MATKAYNDCTSEDLKLSGPHFWPRISAELPVDRYIHRRPELTYSQAIRKFQRKRQKTRQEDLIYIRIFVDGITKQQYPNKRYQAMGSFTHHIQSDPSGDIRLFLQELRDYLHRHLPPTPQLQLVVRLRLEDPDFKSSKNFYEKWI